MTFLCFEISAFVRKRKKNSLICFKILNLIIFIPMREILQYRNFNMKRNTFDSNWQINIYKKDSYSVKFLFFTDLSFYQKTIDLYNYDTNFQSKLISIVAFVTLKYSYN